jgi:hypothetical protein
MLPREHGAYAQLGVPLVAALAASRPTIASASYALAACAAFVAHEPALVLLGHRGTRARRESAGAARLWLVASLLAASVFGAVAFALSPVSRLAILPPAAFAIAAGAIVLRRQERSLVGEVVAGVALASAAVPTAVAGGIAWRDAIALWVVFCAAFLVSTVEVRGVAHRASRASAVARLATWAVALVVVSGVGLWRPLLALAPLPVMAVVAAIVVRAPSAAALRRLGWTLATSSLLTAAAAVAALRVSHPNLRSTLGEQSTGAYTAK